MSEWRPIDTSPKDGTPVFLALEYGGTHYRYVGRWMKDLAVWGRDEVTSALFPAHMQEWFTHWMPLPAPPKQD